MGTAAQHLPRYGFPNAYPGATAEFAKDTRFDSAGNVIGGFGVENVITNDSHSTYHALQTSLSGTVGHGGPGIQASYTWSKSIDDTSLVIGGTGSTGAVTSGFSQNPLDTHPEKAVSNFDVTHGFSLSAAQDLHLASVSFLNFVPQGDHRRLGDAGHFEHQLRVAVHRLLRDSADRSGVERRRSSRSDRQAAALHRAQRPRQTTSARAEATVLTSSAFPCSSPGGTGPNQGLFGTLGRNTFRGPAFYNYDFAFIKDTPLGHRASGAERMDLQFRAEFFNLFNIVTMGLPANILGVSTNTTGGVNSAVISRTNGFGQISKTAGNSRQIQFSLKLIY